MFWRRGGGNPNRGGGISERFSREVESLYLSDFRLLLLFQALNINP